jgi:hypothetical protein
MKNITIEWKHYDKEGETCTRCNNTGENIEFAIKELPKDIKVKYIETKLEAKDMAISNSVLINDVLIEDILGLKASHNHCHSCTCLSGADTDCKTVEDENKIYESIPKEIILMALNKLLKSE